MAQDKTLTPKGPEGGPGEETEIMLGLLNAVDADDSVTQRSLAAELGIALGLVNAYLKRCVKKGLIKVQEVPPRRYAYYLTPQGFTEKSRLTASYLSYSFSFFRHARAACAQSLAQAAGRGWRRAALAGVGDLTEIAAICALESKLEVVAIIDPTDSKKSFAGLPVVAAADGLLGRIDGIIITDLTAAQEAYDAAVRALDSDHVLVPDILAKAIETSAELATEVVP